MVPPREESVLSVTCGAAVASSRSLKRLWEQLVAEGGLSAGLWGSAGLGW